MAPFTYGPFELGSGQSSGAGLESAVSAIRARYPDILGLTSYAGAPGSLSALGFTSPRGDLFAGQPPSTLNQLLASPGPIGQTVAAPESITAALAQGSPLTLLGGSGGGGVPGASTAAGPVSEADTEFGDPAGAGMLGTIGNALASANAATPAASLGRSVGLSPGVSNLGVGVLGQVAGLNALGMLNQAIGLGRSVIGQGPVSSTMLGKAMTGSPGTANAGISAENVGEEAEAAMFGLSPAQGFSPGMFGIGEAATSTESTSGSQSAGMSSGMSGPGATAAGGVAGSVGVGQANDAATSEAAAAAAAAAASSDTSGSGDGGGK